MKHTADNSVQDLVRISLLASIAAIFQLTAVFFPGPGRVLSAFITLPVALAAFTGLKGGFACYLISIGLTLVFLPSELLFQAFYSGPLGLIIGLGLYYNIKTPVITLTGTAVLTAGMLLISYILGVPAFSHLVGNRIELIVIFCAGFCFLYSWAWLRYIRKMIRKLNLFS